MSELNYLEFQPISGLDDMTNDSHRQYDNIILNEQISESNLDSYWSKVVEDIHQDPEWFTFTD